ncbi:hypothetical protein H9L05_19140 [Hymenobacter qilianensis]|uniref:Uncharacterized protein n=1 Tax=Hymenobacter qilianensis TaxID=1385715 RepID=A0A7H0GUN0_9BACT|nr:hypothetical protein [Hymenobacter qilianensis]QNP51996.1 hypothetical protein H9L05_19140 [Hymenobacter qilianensis]
MTFPLVNFTTGAAQLLAFSTAEAQYVVRCGQGIEPALPLAFASFLYMQPAHLGLQRSAGRYLAFYLEDHARAQTVAQLHIFIGADTSALAYSPYQAPFGGIQMAPV